VDAVEAGHDVVNREELVCIHRHRGIGQVCIGFRMNAVSAFDKGLI
jgi:hypothetical protein